MRQTTKIFPLLRYDDPRAAIEWLSKAFGFAVHFVAEDDRGHVAHAQLRLGDGMIMLGPVVPDDKHRMKSPRSLEHQSQSVCVALEDVDDHYELARAAGARVITAPYNTPYNAREYTCLDLEGHIWTFSDYWGEPA